MKTHIYHFGVLLIILATGTLMFFYTQGDRTLQFVIGIVTALAYVGWGCIHHALQKDLHPKVVVEYVLMAAIAVVVLATLLL